MLATLLASGRTLLADGATGTNLFAMGLTAGDAPGEFAASFRGGGFLEILAVAICAICLRRRKYTI